MTWVVDTCIILDILDRHPEFAEMSSRALQSKLDDAKGGKNVVLSAHKAWHEHIMRKRSGNARKRPIADVLIGAYAMQKGGLITRNEADFRSLYPNLLIFNPASLA